ncbi:MAG: hypothetical protein JWQ71_761 [Pedosphaera sp.]|nr:hypothetical protein [Pedosphaera sp.]
MLKSDSEPAAKMKSSSNSVVLKLGKAVLKQGSLLLILIISFLPSAQAQLTLAQVGGSFGSNNLAIQPGATAFAHDVFSGHAVLSLNDGVYGDSNGWVAGTDISFAGINFNGTFEIGSFAFGRDNNGAFHDRVDGHYAFQYTLALSPDASTPDREWITLGTVDYLFNTPNAYLRHVYNLQTPVFATGVRLIVDDSGTSPNTGDQGNLIGETLGIDEFEAYGPTPTPEPGTYALFGVGLLGLAFWKRKALVKTGS